MNVDSSSQMAISSTQLPHRRLVSQVEWHPLDSTRLVSVGHDGNVCVLDPRCPKFPLQRLRMGKEGKVPTKQLAVCWLSTKELAVGGSDGKVSRVSMGQNGLN